MTTITSTAGHTYQTIDQTYAQFHVWSRTWPSHDRRYCGIVWAADATDAGHVARRQYGNGRVYDIQLEKHGRLVRKGA